MNYKGKKIAITGHTGFLGTALVKELSRQGAHVELLIGDVRSYKTFQRLDYTFDYLFHFGAPSSQIQFKKSADYCVDVTINGMRNALEVCEKQGIKLIFPSTGLLSHGQSNEYARCKEVSEDLARGSGADWLAVRVFGTYGPGEEKKADFASVPWLFMQDILAGRSPVVFGDGTQERDFIYIEDTVNSILSVAELLSGQIVDIGTAEPVSFNTLIQIINDQTGSDIKPEYVGAPSNYIKQTGGNIELLKKYYTPKNSITAGIRKMVEYAKGLNQE